MKQWKLRDKLPESYQEVYKGLPDLVGQLLYNRGIHEAAHISRFLNPSYENQYDPFLFSDMRRAVDRIQEAVDKGEKIMVYADYDADAVTAAAVLLQTFRHLEMEVGRDGRASLDQARVGCYIPDRFAEGYGLNLGAFQIMKDQGVSLVITVDCGTNSVDIADFCRDQGIDLIITDHHEITGDLPKAFALINPKNPNDHYPEHQITGVGVAYKVAKALLTQHGWVEKQNPNHKAGWDKWLLDLVSIGTVADCHSLLGENRILVRDGLRVLAKTKWPGLRALLAYARAQQPYDAETLGFLLAPRINAAGRLEHARVALEVLMATTDEEADARAKNLEAINTKRKKMTERILSEAREMATLQATKPLLVLANEAWHKGLVGIVAGKIAEEFKKPAVVLELGENEATGSMRTHGSFNTVDALRAAKDTLLRFGGHKEAAGLTLATEALPLFLEQLYRYAQDVAVDAEPAPYEHLLDAIVDPKDITPELVNIIEAFAPFGAGNPKPQLLFKNLLISSFRKVGKSQDHLQVTFSAPRALAAIGFRLGYLADALVPGKSADVVGSVMQDVWNGRVQTKLRIIDMIVT